MGTGSVVHVYDRNSDEILTYTAGVGWHEKKSKAETDAYGALKAAYYDAFRAARQEINGMEGQELLEFRCKEADVRDEQGVVSALVY